MQESILPKIDIKEKLKEIKNKGFIKSLRKDNTGIGYTLEKLLGIKENNKGEPDFIGISRDGRNRGLFATFCHLRREGPRLFRSDSIRSFSVTDKTFAPSLHGRWKELIQTYETRGLKNKSF